MNKGKLSNRFHFGNANDVQQQSEQLSDLLVDQLVSAESLWKMYNKARDLLPFKARMENLTWRMMYVNLPTKAKQLHNPVELDSHLNDHSYNEENQGLDPAADDFDYIEHIRKMSKETKTKKRPAEFLPVIEPGKYQLNLSALFQQLNLVLSPNSNQNLQSHRNSPYNLKLEAGSNHSSQGPEQPYLYPSGLLNLYESQNNDPGSALDHRYSELYSSDHNSNHNHYHNNHGSDIYNYDIYNDNLDGEGSIVGLAPPLSIFAPGFHRDLLHRENSLVLLSEYNRLQASTPFTSVGHHMNSELFSLPNNYNQNNGFLRSYSPQNLHNASNADLLLYFDTLGKRKPLPSQNQQGVKNAYNVSSGNFDSPNSNPANNTNSSNSTPNGSNPENHTSINNNHNNNNSIAFATFGGFGEEMVPPVSAILGRPKKAQKAKTAKKSKYGSPPPKKDIVADGAIKCTNCRTKTTPLWRRDPEGKPLCNACGLFLKLHGVVRPLSLKTDVIKKRQRGQNTGKKKLILHSLVGTPGGLTPGNSNKSLQSSPKGRSLSSSGPLTKDLIETDGDNLDPTPIKKGPRGMSNNDDPTHLIDSNPQMYHQVSFDNRFDSMNEDQTMLGPGGHNGTGVNNSNLHLISENRLSGSTLIDSNFASHHHKVGSNQSSSNDPSSMEVDPAMQHQSLHHQGQDEEGNSLNWDWLSVTL